MVASLVARALSSQASIIVMRGLYSTGSGVVVQGLSCSVACGNLPRPGIEPTLSGWAGGFFTTEPPGKPSMRGGSAECPAGQRLLDQGLRAGWCFQPGA